MATPNSTGSSSNPAAGGRVWERGWFEKPRNARALLARHPHVVANPTALAFYNVCGFEQTGQQATRFGPAILMRLAVK
jgi:hypothetical protein